MLSLFLTVFRCVARRSSISTLHIFFRYDFRIYDISVPRFLWSAAQVICLAIAVMIYSVTVVIAHDLLYALCHRRFVISTIPLSVGAIVLTATFHDCG